MHIGHEGYAVGFSKCWYALSSGVYPKRRRVGRTAFALAIDHPGEVFPHHGLSGPVGWRVGDGDSHRGK